MDLLPMLISFIVACVIINVCLTKRQMKIARAVFLAFGIAISTCSIFLIYVDWLWSEVAVLSQEATQLDNLVTALLSVSTIVFDFVAVVVAVATIILSVIAIKKIAEYIKSHKRKTQRATSENQKPIDEPIFFLRAQNFCTSLSVE